MLRVRAGHQRDPLLEHDVELPRIGDGDPFDAKTAIGVKLRHHGAQDEAVHGGQSLANPSFDRIGGAA